jgi:hypothetical protein
MLWSQIRWVIGYPVTIFVTCHNLSRWMLGQYLQTGHSNHLLNCYQFTVYEWKINNVYMQSSFSVIDNKIFLKDPFNIVQ